MLQVEIVRTIEEAIGIRSFELEAVDGSALPPASPGAHIDVHLRPGLVRQYSLLNGPADRRYLIAVKREPESRGGSLAMHALREGDRLAIGEPRNRFPVQPGATFHLLLAAGIGVTPLLSMARHLDAAGLAFQLHYFTRSPGHTAFASLLRGLGDGESVRIHEGMEATELGDCLRSLLDRRQEGGHLYMCGPVPFMDLVAAQASGAWPDDALHREYFGGNPDSCASAESFTVRLARSERQCLVQSGESIVEALERVGVQVPVSCEQGICGTCLTAVLSGVPDHRDAFLTDDERRAGTLILPCVSRSVGSELVLDI